MSLNEIKKYELEYPVELIQTKKFKVWPIIRFGLAYQIQGNTNLFLDTIKSNVKKNLIGKFFYGFTNLFRKYDYIVFSDSSERKKINELYVDKSVDYIAEYLDKSLVFETPLPNHFQKSEIPTKFIASKLPLYLITKILSVFIKAEIRNKEVIENILIESRIQLNYIKVVKNFIAQYYIGKFLYFIYKPKAFIVQCSYTNMGYVKAFNDNGIKVIEVQHGLINENHSAYNIFRKVDSSYYPQHLISYGENEKDVFSDNNFFIKQENVVPTGHFYLDSLRKSLSKDDQLTKLKKDYNKSVTISVQEVPIEEEMVRFIKNAASINDHILYIYKTRFKTEADYISFKMPKNVIFVDWLNIYELILQTDCHVTIYSTCALEALSLGKPNFLVNINNLAVIHLSNIIKGKGYSKLIEKPEDLVNEINSDLVMSKDKIVESNAYFIKPNYLQNINEVLKNILNDF